MQSRPAKWWGWGFDDRAVPLESRPGLLAFLTQLLELPDGDPLKVPDAAAIRLPPSRLEERDLADVSKCVGDASLAPSDLDRLTHTVGRSYRDLIRLRIGPIPAPPDLVVFPEADEEVRSLLELCSERDFRVVPFGGGTGVVGGIEVSDREHPHITLDLRRMNSVLGVDEVSLLVAAQAGIRGPLLEEALQSHGLTAGHFPQSFEFSTLGGWIAARSTGALSNRYGNIEGLVAGVRLVAPSGVYDVQARPRHAVGPDLLGLAIGSEGTLGVITQATVRVHRVPAVRSFETIQFPSFSEGLEALRAMAQDGVPPDIAYLMDEDESRLLAAAVPPGAIRMRGRPTEARNLLFFGYEGAYDVVRDRLSVGKRYCRAGEALGAALAEAWFQERYDAPYLRDSMIDHRIMVDAMETATVWSNLERLYAAARKALLNAIWTTGVQGLVGCHVSHLYADGASLYYTFLARQRRGEELSQYDRVKAAVTRAVLENGGHLSHHHGVGAEHAAYLRQAIGAEAWRLLRDLKRAMDPKGIMNPGKLFAVGE